MSGPSDIFHFHVPAEAAFRKYAVYVVVARHREKHHATIYVGKTGDNRGGCNPVISRAGNHLSFNPIHSQSRNHLGNPEEYDFEFFFTTFGDYVDPAESRAGIELVNEMERMLNKLAQELLLDVVNPYKGTRHIPKSEREKREAFLTEDRLSQLRRLLSAVSDFINRNCLVRS